MNATLIFKLAVYIMSPISFQKLPSLYKKIATEGITSNVPPFALCLTMKESLIRMKYSRDMCCSLNNSVSS